MTTETTDEAIDLLQRTRARQIATARSIADELIRKRGHTNSREVRDTMIQRGVFDSSIPDYWLGAVFRNKDYVWTGEWFMSRPPARATNIHAWRPVKQWAHSTVLA